MDRIFDMEYIKGKINYYESTRSLMKDYNKKRRQNDPLFKFTGNMRSRLHVAFKSKGWKKDSKTANILGCTFEEAKRYIESKFKQGMTWENYGKWHVDHIIPLFSASNTDEIIRLCHFSNLQPLWASENISKRNKIEDRN